MTTGEPNTEQRDSQLGELGSPLRANFIAQLKEENFVLFFQSIVPADPSGPQKSFREILVRYKEEEADLLPPGSFLPILEEEGLMHILDRWVIGRLLRWGHDLHASGRRMPRCSVNLSIDTIRREDLAFGDYVLKGMQKLGVSPSSIAFEIMTSDALANRQAVANLIAPLQAAGVKFALSWFAGEESALELAPSLGISFIKIDGSLARKIAREPVAKARLAGLIQRCHKLSIRTVCMLVEDAETLDHLRTIHVDYVQGFGIERPRPLEP